MEDVKTDNNSERITIRSRQVFMITFAVIALSMTAYATAGGVRLFLAEPYAWIGITALAVGFLALTSLVLGDGISQTKWPQIILIAPFFLIAVAICWILSFASYHEQFLSVGKSDLANTETNLRQMSFYTRDVTKAMNEELDDRRTVLIKSDEFATYKDAMIQLADQLKARDNKKDIELKLQSMIEQKRIELINREAKLKAQESTLSSNLQLLKSKISGLERETVRKQDELDDTVSLVGQIELAMQLEEGDPNLPLSERPYIEREGLASQIVDSPACNRRRAAGKGGGSPGTCYYALTEKLTETQNLITELKTSLDIAVDDLQTSRQIQVKEKSVLDDLLAQHEIDKLQSSEEFAADFQVDTNGFLQSINSFIDQPSSPTFNDTASYCENVTAVLSDIGSSTELPTCAPQALTAVFNQLDTIDEDQQYVALACEQSDETELLITELRSDMQGLTGADRSGPINASYDKMRTQNLEACLVAAEQKELDTGPFRADLTALYDRINPSQDAISLAIGKVNSLFNGTASARDYFPALLALLQELSLLLVKLFWDASSARKTTNYRDDEADIFDLDLEAKTDDPVAVLAAKNLLLNTTFDQQKHLLPQMFDEEYSHEMRSHMRRITDKLIRKKLATKSSRGLLVSEGGMAEIAQQIKRHNKISQPQPVMAEIEPASVVEEPLKQEIVEEKPNEAAAEVVEEKTVSKLDKIEAANTDEPEIDPADDEADVKEVSAPKPRKRRPIVVRPNFRREV